MTKICIGDQVTDYLTKEICTVIWLSPKGVTAGIRNAEGFMRQGRYVSRLTPSDIRNTES